MAKVEGNKEYQMVWGLQLLSLPKKVFFFSFTISDFIVHFFSYVRAT